MAGVPSPTEPGPARRGHYALLALFVALALTVAALTYSYLSAETDGIKREAHEELSLIADMKVKQIASFLEDRKGALRVLQENQMNLAALERRLKGASSPGERSRLQVWLEAMQRNRRFSAIVLADPHGQVALSIGQMIAGAEEIAAFVRQTGAHDEVTLRDFHRHPVTGAVRLGLGVPLRRLEGGAPFGVLLVSIDPADSLFPALEQWPTASATGEALLVRQDADGVVVLNAMRRWREAAMSVRVPLARSHVAAVRAAAGAAGAVDGFNYRGIPVFAVARPVPDTPWSLVVELDQAEVQEQLARRFFPAGLAAISLVLAAAAALAFLGRHQQARFYRDLYRAGVERKELEAQLLQSQKMESIGRLAGGVAHDFNNYLTVINGYSEQLCSEAAPGDPIRGPLEEIRAAGERAAALTSQLLAISRRQTVDFKPITLNALVEDSERMLGALLGENIEIVTRLDPRPAAVMADWSQLHQVLLNLAVNARDAMPEGGALTIETSSVTVGEAQTAAHPEARPGRYAVLTVADSGVGMSAETMQKIFEPFFTTKKEGRGTGLGLATAYGIARQTGGWIEAESAPGRGARFRVYLPQIEGAAPARAPDAPKPEDLSGRETILVVEDRPDVRRLALAILGQRGYRLLEAASGAEAIELAGRFDGPIHLLLTDVVMPGMNGRELAARLRVARPTLKVLYTSGYASPSMNAQEADEEAAAFLAKPFTAAELTSMARNVLGSDS
jgi:signal transduction histidine kinase